MSRNRTSDAGVKEVLLPEENLKEAQSLPTYILDAVKLTPVREIREVLERALGGQEGGAMRDTGQWLLVAAILLVASACGVPPAVDPTPLSAGAATGTVQAPLAPAPVPTAVPTVAPTTAPEPSAAPAAVSSAVDAFSFESVLILNGRTNPYLKMAYRKGKLRMDVWATSQWVVFLADDDAGFLYVWYSSFGPMSWSDDGQNTIMKYPSQSDDPFFSGPVSPKDLFGEVMIEGKLAGTEAVDGKLCDVYERATGSPNRVWIWRETGLPLRWDWATSYDEGRVELRNVQWGSAPDDVFNLPAGMPVKEVDSLPMGAMAPAMAVPGGPSIPAFGAGTPPTPSPRR